MNQKMRVADFFCGAGGFSQGFKQAGFDIVFALDNWTDAQQTHKLNHPECIHPGLDCYHETKGDILLIAEDRINEIVPDVEVIIGSPPCVSFSSSNRAGKADKTLGIALIKKFLQIIAVKKHMPKSNLRYWIMENVPNSSEHIEEKYSFKDLNLDNQKLRKLRIRKNEEDIALEIDKKDKIFNAVYYGVPQKRMRFICGEFPEPKRITEKEEEFITLGHVIDALNNKRGLVYDPIYGYSINSDNLTDHHYGTIIPKFEWEEAYIKKQQARYYGKMSFPENPNKPARTVMATRSILAREAMILPNGSPNNFRAPTIREAASLMSFPITYLFQSENEASKYRLVGNAVCPRLASELAFSILREEGINKNKIIKHYADIKKLKTDLKKNPPPPKVARDKDPLANFAEIVPDLKIRNFRVELDNNLPKLRDGKIKWNSSIHHATGKDSMKVSFPTDNQLSRLLVKFEDKKRLNHYISEINRTFKDKIPKTKIFQAQHCLSEPDKDYFTPRKSLAEIKRILEDFFPDKDFKDSYLLNENKSKKPIIKFDRGEIPDNIIPLKIVLAYLGVKYVVSLTK